MKTTVRTGQVQGMNLTPQLLQSIRLLQLTAQQLEMEVRQALDRNPLLEHDEAGDDVDSQDEGDDAPLDTAAWDELPEPQFLAGVSGQWTGEGDDAMARIAEQSSSDPRVRLLRELALHWKPRDLELAAWWLDRCDDRGYLEHPLPELIAQGAQAFPQRAHDLETIRQRLLHGEWPGMAAADAGECLRAQLALQPASAVRDLAAQLLTHHLALLAAHDDAALADATGASADDVRAAIALVLALRPHPVEAPADAEDTHIVPDVVAWFGGGAWRVALNGRSAPRVRVAPHCERALAGNGGEHAVLRGLLDEARWLVRGLAMRNDTLLRTTQILVERQAGFLEHGEVALAPLTLREVAEAIGMHESTVSRIVSGKYLQTPRGTIELKKLFAVRLEGAEIGGAAVRALVKRLIDAEPANAPLADDVIAGLLARQGVRIARRTVAKYRDQLAIGPVRARQRIALRA